MVCIGSSSSVTIYSFFFTKQKLSICSIKGHPTGFHRRLFFLSIVPFHSYLVALAEFSAQSYLKYLCVTVLCHCLPQLTLIDSQVICTASNVELEQEQHYKKKTLPGGVKRTPPFFH